MDSAEADLFRRPLRSRRRRSAKSSVHLRYGKRKAISESNGLVISLRVKHMLKLFHVLLYAAKPTLKLRSTERQLNHVAQLDDVARWSIDLSLPVERAGFKTQNYGQVKNNIDRLSYYVC